MGVEVRATRRATRRQFATNEPTLRELQEQPWPQQSTSLAFKTVPKTLSASLEKPEGNPDAQKRSLLKGSVKKWSRS